MRRADGAPISLLVVDDEAVLAEGGVCRRGRFA
jgi:hypothetical protein